jgi:hypothetical protein
MFAAAVDQGSDGAAVNDVEAAALQWKSLIGEIPDWRRKIQFTIEPGLHRVLIGGDNVGEMSGLERTQMSIDDLGGKHCILVVAPVNGDELPACIRK